MSTAPSPDRKAEAFVATSALRDTPENWSVYNRPTNDDAFLGLVESVKENGILEPLIISKDNYVLSGHRRLAAAHKAGLAFVPVTRTGDEIEGMDPAERLKVLVKYNEGSRRKTEQELVREAMVGVDPEAAVIAATNRRTQLLTKSKTSFPVAVARGKVARTSVMNSRREFLAAVLAILHEFETADHLPVGGRAIHYRLLGFGVLTSRSKGGHVYGQGFVKAVKYQGDRIDSAKFLSRLLTDARAEGIIDDDWISDETRPCKVPRLDKCPADYINGEIGRMFDTYYADIHQDQPFHVEIMVEKNTMFNLLWRKVASPLRLPIESARGYSSGSQRHRINERFLASGKDKLVIVYAGDHDPDGLEMPRALVKYMEYDLGTKPTVIPAAVTMEQIRRLNLAPDMDAKSESTRFKNYVEETGETVCWELDSLPFEELIASVTAACKSVMDMNILNAALEQEKQDDIRLAQLRAATVAFVAKNSHLINRP
jgi:hypothetical protein